MQAKLILWLASIAIVAVFVFVLFEYGRYVQRLEDDAATLRAQKQEVTRDNRANEQDTKTAKAHEVKREQQRQHDIKTVELVTISAIQPDYNACQLRTEDMQLLNDAIIGGPVYVQ